MTPWIVNGDYDYGAMKMWVDTAMEAAGSVQGGEYDKSGDEGSYQCSVSGGQRK